MKSIVGACAMFGVVIALSGISGCSSYDVPQERVIHGLVRAHTAEAADTALILQSPEAMMAWRDSLVIVDRRGARIHVVSRGLEGGRSFGVRGQGPGELASPRAVASLGDTLVVYDRGNGRFVRFDPEGAVIDHTQEAILSLHPKFILRGARVLIPVMSDDAYAQMDSAGTVRPVFSRVHGPEGAARTPRTAHMLVESNETDYLVDTEDGLVLVPSGVDTLAVRLPDEIWTQVQPEIDRLSSPERIATPIVASGPAPEGLLVWILKSGPIVGALLSGQGEWALIRTAPEAGDLPLPNDVMIWDDELILLSSDGIRVYRMGTN